MEKDRQESLIWCGMNRSFPNEENISMISKVVKKPRTSEIYKKGGVTDEHSMKFQIPPMILYMRQTGIAFNNLYIGEDLSHNHIPLPLDIVKANARLPSVIIQFTVAKQARKYMANVDITTDPQIALKRMLERHLLGAESYRNGEECNIFDFEDAGNDFIFMSELKEMLTWTWDTFYPGGKKLTSELMLEVDDLFQKWRKSQIRLESCSNDYPEGCTRTLGANFSEFSAWFTIVCEVVEFHTKPSRQADAYDMQS